MTTNTKQGAQGAQHGARDEILGRIRRALQIPARYGHAPHTAPHPAPPSPEPIAADNSNPVGTNATHVPGARVAREAEAEGAEIGIYPLPERAEDAPELAGWVPSDTSADAPGTKGGKSMSIPLTVLNGAQWRAWLPPVGEAYEDRVALLERNLLDLKADFVRVQGEEALQVLGAEMAQENGWSRIARHASPLLDAALGGLEGKMQVLGADAQSIEPGALEACEAGWTTCDALIAQTGTVLLSAREAGGRSLSVLPPHHVVVATREQLVADLPQAFEEMQSRYGDELPSAISFITGPSRTGDIERILVLGAHGPKRLTVILVE